MPRVQLSVEVPKTEYQQLEQVASQEGVTVRGLLVWAFKSDVVERARKAVADRKALQTEAA